jgi:Nucleoside H+ symporter
VLTFLQLQALCSSPTWGLATTIVLTSLANPPREFGPIRVWATIGWMLSGWIISYLLHADASPRGALVAGFVWWLVAALTLALPRVPPPTEKIGRSWRELLGLEALGLLHHREHGVLFITAALVSIPLAAFYPFAAMHLRDLGEPRVAAVMSLGQVSEIVAMYALSPLLARLGLKWLLLTGISFGVLRYALFAMNTLTAMLVGIALHGLCFTLIYIPAQIYVERRIARRLHARAQALLTLMVAGVGTLAGSLFCGWWREACFGVNGTDWPVFWLALCVAMVSVFAFLAFSYLNPEQVATRVEDDTEQPA